MQSPLLPINVLQQAVGDHVKGVAEELNVSLTTIYKMLSDDGYDPYGRLLAMYGALLKRNPEGAQLLFEDFRARHEAAIAGEVIKGGSREEAVADMLNTIGEFIKGGPDFEVKANQAIRAIRFLIVVSKV